MLETITTRIGIVGTGAIAEAIVDGIRAGSDEGPAIFLSPRNARTAEALARRHPRVLVCDDNQAVVDAASVVLLTIRPQAVGEALRDLSVSDDRLLISAVAGWSIEALRVQLNTGATIVRTIPLPAVRHRQGITALFPGHPVAEDLFEPLGGTLVTSSPESFDVLSAATASMSTYLHYLDTIAGWVAQQGFDPQDADDYVRSMFLGVSGALADRSIPLSELGGAHETAGGNNEALRARWFNQQNTAALQEALDGIQQRVSGGTLGRSD